MHKFFMAVASLLVTASVSPLAHADEQSFRKAVEEYFTIAKMDVVMQRSVDVALTAQIRAQPSLKQFEPKMRQFFTKYMGWKSLQDDFTAMYMRSFTEDEFKQMLAFYKTPVGRKVLQVMPTLMEEGATIGLKRVQEHAPELQKIMADSSTKQVTGGVRSSV